MATPQQVRRRGRWSLILGTFFAFAALAAVAYADDITNDLPGSVKVMALNEGGDTGSTSLTVIPTGSGNSPADGKSGCNLTGSSASLVVSVSSSDTSVATVSPTSLTFTSCGDVKTVTVTPHAEGSANVTLAQTSNNTGATFNLAPAAFRVDVAPPPNTAPDVTVTGVTHGAEYVKGSVPVAGCSVEDAEDGDSTFAASLSGISGTYASDGLGNQIATCSYTDNGGLTETVTASYSIYDESAPGIASGIVGTLGNNDWYVSNVVLSWTVTEGESPNSLVKTGCVNQDIIADQGSTSYSCSASSAGGSTGPVTVSIKRDATAPLVSGAPTSSPNAAGWYNSDVIIDWTCSDATSGLAASCPADSTISGEGQGLTASSGNVLDHAGNSSSAISAPAVNIDKTAPNLPTVDLSPVANAQGWNNAAVTATFVWAGDGGVAGAQSGEGSCTAPITVSVESLTAAGTAISGTCTDKAGNSSAVAEAVVKLDLTDPTIDADADGYVPGSWTNQTVTVTFDCFDALSGLLGTCPAPVIVSSNTSAEGQNVSGSIPDNAGNTATSGTINVKVDKTKPTISGATNPAAPDGTNSWYKTAPAVTFTCADALSGLASCVIDGSSSNSVTLGESAAAQTVAGTATDEAGNTETASVAGLKVDLSNPAVPTWGSTGISDGGSYYFGSVPAAPTCSSSDAISGLRDCVVTGRLATVGTHTLTATATDNAGRTSTATRSYTVLAWTLNGFFQPVDMGTNVFNTVKSGSTVPLKFRVFAGSTELTDISAIKSLSYVKVTCAGVAIEDAIEEIAATGGTLLRYDSTGGQFIYNLKTSGKAGDCYRATMTTLDGSKLEANFKLK